jgi:hypothetical protein
LVAINELVKILATDHLQVEAAAPGSNLLAA